MNLRTLFFLARKDLLSDFRTLFLVLLGVGSGALAIIPLNGLLSGFTSSLTATTVDVSVGHVIVSPPAGSATISGASAVAAQLASMSGVEAVSPRLTAAALGDATEAASVRGVDPAAETRATSIARHVVAGRFLDPSDTDAIAVGRKLADNLRVEIGQELRVLFANGGEARLLVVGIYDSGVRELDTGATAPLVTVQKVLGQPDQASEVIVRLKDRSKSKGFAARIQDGWKVETWEDRVAFIHDIDRNVNIIRVMLVSLAVLATGIATAVLMYTTVQHKTRAIGILKAIGSRNRAILRLYLIEGVLLGLGGAVVGDIIGSAITLYLHIRPIHSTYGASEGSARVIEIAASYSWQLMIVPTVSAIAIATVASLYPAWQAARIKIVEAIWHG